MDILKTYLSKTGQSLCDFAQAVDISVSYASEIVNGKKLPGLSTAVRIQEYTGGVVTAVSWIHHNTNPTDSIPQSEAS
jgi:transcriptional regulator with XRE-family HTH domain